MTDAFRGMAGALERAHALEEENVALRRELVLYDEVIGRDHQGLDRLLAERDRLLRENEELRQRAPVKVQVPVPFTTARQVALAALLIIVFFVVPTLVLR
ncbi:MAG TPA: hypothetical protein VIF62_13770 [Labilithrix sp.]